MDIRKLDDCEKDFDNGLQFYRNKNYRNSGKIFKALARKGYSKAQYYMGLTYERGHGVFKSHKTAFKWYLMSAENG